MAMSDLILPPNFRKHQAQMSKPVVFWFNRKENLIWNPPSWMIDRPWPGFEKIECRHAAEVEMWSRRLAEQEKRLLEMELEQRYNIEEPMRQRMMRDLEDKLHSATDPVNREFLARAIERIKAKRENIYKQVIESRMACEAKDGVAS
jgi:hypothetical protein